MRHEAKVRQFEAICREHNGFLKACVWKLTGNEDRFSEAWQHVLTAVWQHLEKSSSQNGRSYLYRIVLSAVSKAWENRCEGCEIDFETTASLEKGPLDEVGDKELTDRVRQEIAHLPPQQGQAMMMRYLEGRDYEHIAEALDCSEASARSHVSKALAGLRKRLKNLLDKEGVMP